MASLALVIISCLAMLAAASSEVVRRDVLMDTLHSGMKFAQGLLGSESVALKVAEFVVRAFNPTATTNGHSTTAPHRLPPDSHLAYHDTQDQDHKENEPAHVLEHPTAPLGALRQLVRLLGLRPSQLGAVAVNALLLVAQLIATFLGGPSRPRPNRLEDPSSWLLQRQSVPLQQMLAAARNESLADSIQQMVAAQGPEDTGCLRLLACKIAPFVNSMQRAVFGDDDGVPGSSGSKGPALYRHLPSKDQVFETSEACEAEHRDCDLNEV